MLPYYSFTVITYFGVCEDQSGYLSCGSAFNSRKNSRSIAWSQGLEQVLIKASGDVNITNNPVIQKAARDGSDYLAKFTYGKLDGQQSLDMQYNPKQIHALLQQAKVSFGLLNVKIY